MTDNLNTPEESEIWENGNGREQAKVIFTDIRSVLYEHVPTHDRVVLQLEEWYELVTSRNMKRIRASDGAPVDSPEHTYCLPGRRACGCDYDKWWVWNGTRWEQIKHCIRRATRRILTSSLPTPKKDPKAVGERYALALSNRDNCIMVRLGEGHYTTAQVGTMDHKGNVCVCFDGPDGTTTNPVDVYGVMQVSAIFMPLVRP